MWPFKKRSKDAGVVFDELRSMVFDLNPKTVGVQVKPDEPFGAVMEMGTAGSIVTVVAVLDGTVSMYVRGGASIIGGGENEDVLRAGLAFIACSANLVGRMQATRTFPTPEQDEVRFYVLTAETVRTKHLSRSDVLSPKSDWGVLFSAGQEIITQLRLMTTTRSES